MKPVEPTRTIWRGGRSLTYGSNSVPTPAQTCLVRAATGPVSAIEQELATWRSLVDLNGPIDGGSYRLIPTVFHRMQATGLDDPHRGMFKGVYRRSVVESARLLDAVKPVLAELNAANIVPWLSKGAGLISAGYYPTPATRPMTDVDLVVESAQREQTIRVLASLGYLPRFSERMMRSVHAAPFVDDSGVELDLHSHLLGHARSAAADEVITRDSRVIELDGVSVKVPGPTGLIIVSAVHGLVSNPEPPVRWLVDVAMILERDRDQVVWGDVVEFATRFRMARRLEGALTLLAEITGHLAPESTMMALAALPTRAIERVERRVSTAAWNSKEGALARLVAGYAGADRELRHVITRLPRHLADRWNVEHVFQFPVAAGRNLTKWLRTGRS